MSFLTKCKSQILDLMIMTFRWHSSTWLFNYSVSVQFYLKWNSVVVFVTDRQTENYRRGQGWRTNYHTHTHKQLTFQSRISVAANDNTSWVFDPRWLSFAFLRPVNFCQLTSFDFKESKMGGFPHLIQSFIVLFIWKPSYFLWHYSYSNLFHHTTCVDNYE